MGRKLLRNKSLKVLSEIYHIIPSFYPLRQKIFEYSKVLTQTTIEESFDIGYNHS